MLDRDTLRSVKLQFLRAGRWIEVFQCCESYSAGGRAGLKAGSFCEAPEKARQSCPLVLCNRMGSEDNKDQST